MQPESKLVTKLGHKYLRRAFLKNVVEEEKRAGTSATRFNKERRSFVLYCDTRLVKRVAVESP